MENETNVTVGHSRATRARRKDRASLCWHRPGPDRWRHIRAAATLAPVTLRTLDAIYLATALSLGPDVSRLVTYDDRL